MGGIEHSPALLSSLEQQHPAGQAGNQAVSHLKGAIAGGLLGEILRQQGPAPFQKALAQKGIPAGVRAVQGHRQHTDHRPLSAHGAQNGRGVNAHRSPCNHRRASNGQLVAKLFRLFLRNLLSLPGAYHRDGWLPVHVGQAPFPIQYRRRVKNIPQRQGIFFTLRGNHLPIYPFGILQLRLGLLQGKTVQGGRLFLPNAGHAVPSPGPILVKAPHPSGPALVDPPGHRAALPKATLYPNPVHPLIHEPALLPVLGPAPTTGWWPPPRRSGTPPGPP